MVRSVLLINVQLQEGVVIEQRLVVWAEEIEMKTSVCEKTTEKTFEKKI